MSPKSDNFIVEEDKDRTLVNKSVTVEPLLCFYLIGTMICGVAFNTLTLEMACRSNLQYNNSICTSVLTGDYQEQNFTAEYNNLQTAVTNLKVWQHPLQIIVPFILILFLGSYSDRNILRKPFLLIPIFGQLIAIGGCILCLFFMMQWPVLVQTLVQVVLPSFFGGSPMVMMACFAYIADVSTIQMRTFRIGVVQIMYTICNSVAQIGGGYLFASVGYLWVFVIGGLFNFLAIMYGIFCIKEPKKPVVPSTKRNLFLDVFDYTHLTETIKLLFTRFPLILIMALLFIYCGVIDGENGGLFLFAQMVYKWTLIEFTYYSMLKVGIQLAGIIIALPLLTKGFRWHDLTITAICFLDKVICNIIIILMPSVMGLYTGTLVNLIIGLALITLRSQATKAVSDEDYGKSQVWFGIVECLAPTLVTLFYNKVVYSLTMPSFPPAFLILGVLLFGLKVIVTVWLYVHPSRKRRDSAKSLRNGKLDEFPESSYF